MKLTVRNNKLKLRRLYFLGGLLFKSKKVKGVKNNHLYPTETQFVQKYNHAKQAASQAQNMIAHPHLHQEALLICPKLILHCSNLFTNSFVTMTPHKPTTVKSMVTLSGPQT
jgi:hypothetical protein